MKIPYNIKRVLSHFWASRNFVPIKWTPFRIFLTDGTSL